MPGRGEEVAPVARAGRTVGITALVLVLAGGGYLTADAYDVAPGFLTLAPEPDPAAPFPTAPGAQDATTGTGVLSDLDPAAPIPSAEVLAGQVSGLTTDPRLGPNVGVLVADALTGEVLAQNNPDQGRTPASTQKLVTAVAALTDLGADTTFDTTVVQGGAADQIVLVGGGDMMLAAGEGDPDAVNGRAGLADLAAATAAQLRLAGVSSVTLGLDDTLFTGDALAPGWDPADVGAGYAAPVAALGVNIAKLTDDEYAQRQTDPAMSAAGEFARRLAEQGITVQGNPSRVQSGYTAGDTLATVSSAPVSEVTGYFLDHSDNTITEVVSRMVAVHRGFPASFEGATQAVLQSVRALGVDITGAVLTDASGLAEGSSLSPALLLDLLQLIVDPAHPELRSVGTGMPIAGLTGTLSDRFTSGAGTGVVRAKTGSLKGVTSLAGLVLDADGRMLLYVVMADQTGEGGQWGPRQAIDGFVTGLAGCGCQG
ncbi:D-alanyl-D-alanine carboxypeptidase/D-alanyl-D-alanine endopeptidase [Cellulomonas denverensis]|uniref:D-alanyl-D-alanine carboxypeptidase/D-alanyl-D-alanine endopeptidase n=1 Tax=Cellulomonas denverensis TaxID=264297 RepID=UPI001B3511BB